MNDKDMTTRRTASPSEIAEALALREAGYTALAISQKLGIPVRSLHRHFTEHGAKKGALKREALSAARADLMGLVMSDEAIRMEAAKLVADDLAHARHLREVLIQASEKLEASTLGDAVLVMRAAAAYSTAIKNTSDMLRHGLRMDQRAEVAESELPELVISELSAEDVKRLRKTQKDSEEIGA